MKIQLYHGTTTENADRIMREGFKDRVKAKRSNWTGKVKSMQGFIYLTTAYPFYFAQCSAKAGDKSASIIKVVVETHDLYPDEDYIRYANRNLETFNPDEINLEDYKHAFDLSLKNLGCVAIKDSSFIGLVGRKDFDWHEMWQYSDPSISPMNYAILGNYYRELTDKWWNGEDWKSVKQFPVDQFGLQLKNQL